MDWKVWKDRGYCALGNSISAYVDFTPTPSGAIRCVGPFSVTATSAEVMQSAMRSLTVMLESQFLEEDQFVLWGSYCDHPQYKEHEITVLGTICGYIPVPWLRTHLLGYDSISIAREWEHSNEVVSHRSGLQFPCTALSVADTMIFHPSTLEESIVSLSGHSFHIARLLKLDRSHDVLHLPHFRWSPSNESLGRRA